MSSALGSLVASLQRSAAFVNSVIAALTVGGQRLFSSFTFRCPCQVGRNFYYGSAFLLLPALVLLLVGYALRSQVWTVARESCCCRCARRARRPSALERRLACLRFLGISGRALVAPLAWLASTLLTGTYYECAASEFASVDHHRVFDNVPAGRREEMLAGFPCHSPSAPDVTLVRDEVALLHRYQSQMLGWILITVATAAVLVSSCLARCCSPFTPLQHFYWTAHLRNEKELFEQAAEEHSRLLVKERIKKLFGFIPGSEDVKDIRIPSGQDWKEISAPSLVCVGDATQGLYSFLGDRVVEDNEEDKSEGIELKP